MHNEQAIKAGGTLAQAVVLLNLNPNKGTPSTSLGPKMGLESTSLGRTLKSMEINGLIKRVPNEEDRRGVFILLTNKGKELRAVSKKSTASQSVKKYQKNNQPKHVDPTKECQQMF